MKRRIIWLALLSGAIAVMALYHVGNVRATPAGGFAATTLAKGTLGPFEAVSYTHLTLPTTPYV